MKLVVDEASLVSVADAIREKGGTSESLEFPNGFVDAVNGIESGGGGTEEIENIIDASGVLESTDGTVEDKVEQLIDKAEDANCFKDNIMEAKALFYKAPTIKKLPRINFERFTSLRYLCAESSVESVDYYINSSKATDCYQAFWGCSNLKFVYGIDLSASTSNYELFKNCPLLETIQEKLDLSKNTSNISGMFVGDTLLIEVRFVEGCICATGQGGAPNFISCSKLSNDSIKSIINGLATVAAAQTLRFHADVKAKLTEDQLVTITNKNWSVA